MNFFCSKDCPDLCGVQADYQNGRYSFKGVAEDWADTGFVCSKFKVFAEREINNGIKSYKSEDGTKTEYQSDAEAISALAEMLKTYKDKKILYMRGSGSLAYNMAYWDVLFSGFENCWATSGGPCDNTGGDSHEADFGTEKNPPVTNLENADTIILYGKNAAICSQHLYAYLKELKKKGKKIVYLDPIRTKTAELADRYIMIKPCTDGLLACALLCELGLEKGYDPAVLLAETGVSQGDFDYILHSIKNGKTAHIEGFGIQRHANGMNAFQWINRLAVKTGSQDMLYFGHGSKRKWQGLPKSFAGMVHVDRIADVLAQGDFDLFVCVGANPAMTFPDTKRWVEALSSTKTLVVETNHTHTSAHADFFLKVGGMFAQKDYMGSYFFTHDHKRERLTDEMCDMEAAKALADRLGISMEIIEQAEEVPQLDRKYQTEKLSLTMPESSDSFMFISSSHHAYLNSQTLPGMEQGLQVVYINDKDAAKMGIRTGDDVTVSNETGDFTAEALVTDGICEKVIMCWKNIPMKKGFLNNAVPNKLTDSGNGLVYYTVFVDIKKA